MTLAYELGNLAGEADLVAARLAANLDDWSKQNRVDQAEADELAVRALPVPCVIYQISHTCLPT